MTARRFAIGGFAFTLVGCLGTEPDPAPAGFARDVVPFLSKRCFHCHGNGKSAGNVALDQYKDDKAVQKDRELWENVIKVVRAGSMPPRGKNRKGKDRTRPAPEEFEPALKAV